jgi:GNAT superfamily N-acetyltransferase
MIIRTTSENLEFQKLVMALDAHLLILDGEEHAFFSQFNGLENIKYAVIYCIDNKAVGCGGLKKIDLQTAEIKRMYVEPEYRGRGVAAKILTALETWATELDFNQLCLETGVNNPSAQSVYRKKGFEKIINYGPYFGVPSSVCMGKGI